MRQQQINLFDANYGNRIPPDICSGKHGGNSESIEANPSQFAKRQAHERILAILQVCNKTGQEVANVLNVPYHKISGRISELRHKLRLIEPTGERRNGGAVLRIK